jgi:hypothetical protein
MLTGWVGQGLDVQHRNLYAPLGQQLDDLAANAARPAGDDDDFPGPVILVVDPVVHDFAREVVVDPPDEPKDQQLLEA